MKIFEVGNCINCPFITPEIRCTYLDRKIDNYNIIHSIFPDDCPLEDLDRKKDKN